MATVSEAMKKILFLLEQFQVYLLIKDEILNGLLTGQVGRVSNPDLRPADRTWPEHHAVLNL